MSARQSDAYYPDLERRARDLCPLAKTVLAADAYKWFVEFIDAGEYGWQWGLRRRPCHRHEPFRRRRCASD
jgi:hypothetical protein